MLNHLQLRKENASKEATERLSVNSRAPSFGERFASAQEAANFLGISRRMLLAMARRGIAGAYPIGTGDLRKTWIFRLSEISAAIDPKSHVVFGRRPPQSVSGYDPIIGRSSLK